MPELLVYVHGVIPAADAPAAADLPGITDDHPVSVITEGQIAALTSLVPANEFDEAELRERLEDLEWVERVARAHEAVLDELLSTTTVVPMRMCTIYRTEAALRAMLRDEWPTLAAALARFAGTVEWGVKAFAAIRAQVAPAQVDADRPASGTDYLLARRRQRDEAAAGAQQHETIAAEIHGTLVAIAVEATRGRPQPAELTGRAEPMILNGSYLLEQPAQDAFHRALDELHERFGPEGIELEPTGPWPPYHFLPDLLGATG